MMSGRVPNIRHRWSHLVSGNSPRQCVAGIANRLTNKKFAYSLISISSLGAKVCHLLAHRTAFRREPWRYWAFAAFAQDTVVLVLLRLLFEDSPRRLARLRLVLGILISPIVCLVNTVAINFFISTGSEIHWRNMGIVTDASSRAMLLTGLVSYVFVLGVTFGLGILLRDAMYTAMGVVTEIMAWPFKFAGWLLVSGTRMIQMRNMMLQQHQKHDALGEEDTETHDLLERGHRDNDESTDSDASEDAEQREFSNAVHVAHKLLACPGVKALQQVPKNKIETFIGRALFILLSFVVIAQVVCWIDMPKGSAMVYMSWAACLLPVVDLSQNKPTLSDLVSHFNEGIQRTWDDKTGLAEPPAWSWIPNQALPGFEHWQEGKGSTQYHAAADPMKILNADDDLLEGIRGKLADVPIRHVMLIFLESTRNDVFPLKKEGLAYQHISEDWTDKKLRDEAYDFVSRLNPTANYLTGDYDDGFEHEHEQPVRGGIRCNKAITTATYTLKSLTSTLCGLFPYAADFNEEASSSIYQPCLPHIFEAVGRLGETFESSGSDNKDDQNTTDSHYFSSYPWSSSYMQTSTKKFDSTMDLFHKIGWQEKNIIHKEYLRSDDAKFGKQTQPMTNYFAFEEDPLEDYIRDIFQNAKRNNERAFITHLTSTTHHPWKLPSGEKNIKLSDTKKDLSNYLNAEHYSDKWLRKILDTLESEGVANETLMVFQGDHGVSLPENEGIASYYNPSIGNDRIPLVLSHPMLPPIEVNDLVTTMQILPTILDLLVETGSLDSTARGAASDMLRNYEGQSLLRPQRGTSQLNSSSTTAAGDWKVTVINPGGSNIVMRDARFPERRLIVPIILNVEWAYSDIEEDPTEESSVTDFDFSSLLRKTENKHGEVVARWVEEAAFVARWWAQENRKRWRSR